MRIVYLSEYMARNEQFRRRLGRQIRQVCANGEHREHPEAAFCRVGAGPSYKEIQE